MTLGSRRREAWRLFDLLIALGPRRHTEKPLICADYVTLISDPKPAKISG